MIKSIEKGRKEDGNRSIADKIIKRLHDLNKTIESNYGRWAWELLQNAKDSVAGYTGESISIQIELNDDYVIFRHNGIHFSENDVRGIINQISSKEMEGDEQKRTTGRFGTGFLTTHLLSRCINVKGILETVDGDFFSFEFPLNREGSTTSQLIPKIELAWSEFHNSAKQIDKNYERSAFNTSFTYNLVTTEQKNIAKTGIEEFVKLIPFVLVFNQIIKSVEIIDKTSSLNIVFSNTGKVIDSFIHSIQKTENEKTSEIFILKTSNDQISISTLLMKCKDGYSIESINDFPKLFCDFPLIGTESFHFPVIINSFYFNPLTERDGVWLKGKKEGQDIEVDENQNMIEQAVILFKELIEHVSGNAYYNLYNMAETTIPYVDDKYFDEAWFYDKIQTPIRDILFNSNIVEMEENNLKKSIKDLWFPSKIYSKNVKANLWKFTFDLFPDNVCKKDHQLEWSMLAWDDWKKLTYDVIAASVSKQANISNLCGTLKLDKRDAFNWLNSFCNFLLTEEINETLFEKYPLIPNQKEVFLKKSELNIDKINDDALIQIQALLSDDWRSILLHKRINFGKYTVKEKKDIANSITEKLKGQINNTENNIRAISLLSEWFENNKELGKDLFSELYRRRAEIFMNTIADKDNLYKVMRSKTDLAQLSRIAQALEDDPKLLENLRRAEELSSLLREFKATDVAELKRMLLVAQGITTNNQKTEITQNDLVSLGITSIEELEDALKDKNLSSLYHISTTNADMFVYVQSLISRAKANILQHLESQPQYDCSEVEELANTVLGGIKKDGLSIHIVVRPSDNGIVIIYYSSERDTLDYENAELWIDNGITAPQQLTLGKILKTTGINKIPV